MTRASILAALALACGCGASDDRPANYHGDGFAVALPSGWSPVEDRGAVIATAPTNPAHTIVVRAAPRGDRSADDILRATHAAIAGLPAAKLDAPWDVDVDGDARGFTVSFVPPGRSDRYVRTHVVVVGDELVFHVFETSRRRADLAGDLATTVARSLREEV